MELNPSKCHGCMTLVKKVTLKVQVVFVPCSTFVFVVVVVVVVVVVFVSCISYFDHTRYKPKALQVFAKACNSKSLLQFVVAYGTLCDRTRATL